MSDTLTQYDKWLLEDDVAAITIRQQLQPAEGPGAAIFPPTFAPENEGEKGGYNIDHFGAFQATVNYRKSDAEGFDFDVRNTPSGNVCLIDSVGAEANRIEILFLPDRCGGKYADLVPQVVITAGEEDVNLLEAGHRAGDALVRFTPFGEAAWDAFRALLNTNNAEPLARIAPTSLVFGVWDSRGTQAKLPRVFRSVIRAYDVKPMTRSAQYNRAMKYVEEGVIKEELDKGSGDKNPLSREGFKDNPAGSTHGGVIVEGDLRREMIINLNAIRRLRKPQEENTKQNDREGTLALRRYILGLALVAATAKNSDRFDLREGCLLKVKNGHVAEWKAVPFDGEDQAIEGLNADSAFAYATAAAKAFGVTSGIQTFAFDSEAANKWLALDGKEQDKRRRQGPMTRQFPKTDESSSPPTQPSARKGRQGGKQ